MTTSSFNKNPQIKIDCFRGKYGFLSNMHECEVVWEGIKFPTSEHAFVAGKTLDKDLREKISQIETPSKAKKFGREFPLRKDWKSVKFNIMLEIVRIKFKSNPILAEKLIQTGSAELVEGNWWGDKEWGVYKGVGTNHLGRILMKVRSELNGTIYNDALFNEELSLF